MNYVIKSDRLGYYCGRDFTGHHFVFKDNITYAMRFTYEEALCRLVDMLQEGCDDIHLVKIHELMGGKKDEHKES